MSFCLLRKFRMNGIPSRLWIPSVLFESFRPTPSLTQTELRGYPVSCFGNFRIIAIFHNILSYFVTIVIFEWYFIYSYITFHPSHLIYPILLFLYYSYLIFSNNILFIPALFLRKIEK